MFICEDSARRRAGTLTISSSSFASFSLLGEMSLHHTAGPVLSCGDHAVAHGHVHGGAGAGVMSVEETGAVLVFSDQLQVQEVLKQTSRSLLERQLGPDTKHLFKGQNR